MDVFVRRIRLGRWANLAGSCRLRSGVHRGRVEKRRPVVRENHGPKRKKKEGERGKGLFNDVFRSCWLGTPSAAGIIAA